MRFLEWLMWYFNLGCYLVIPFLTLLVVDLLPGYPSSSTAKYILWGGAILMVPVVGGILRFSRKVTGSDTEGDITFPQVGVALLTLIPIFAGYTYVMLWVIRDLEA